jgi:hypothetical protein
MQIGKVLPPLTRNPIWAAERLFEKENQMVDNNDQGPIRKTFGWMIDNPEWTLVGTHVLMGLFRGRVSDNAPDNAKNIAASAGIGVGGAGKPEDEAGFAYLIQQVGKGKARHEREELKAYLREFITTEFHLEHESSSERGRGEAKLEEWRVKIMSMMKDYGKPAAVSYLTDIAYHVLRNYTQEVNRTGKNLNTVRGVQKRNCWERACHKEARRLHSEGIHFPHEEPTPLIELAKQRIRHLPKALVAGKEAAFKKWNEERNAKFRKSASDKAKKFAKEKWQRATEATKSFDQAVHNTAQTRKEHLKQMSWSNRLICKVFGY